MAEGDWYWCLTHKAVEPYEACRSEVRLGPYPTPEDAAHALERVHGRNEQWDNDPVWNDPEDDNAADHMLLYPRSESTPAETQRHG